MSDASNWRSLFRGYQLENAEWLTQYPSQHQRARLLADGLGTGKALALSTLIPTPDGWKTMGELHTGDRVFAENGKPCTVVATHEVPHPDGVFDVYFVDGEVIRACGDHLWLTWGNGARKAARRSNQARDGVMYAEVECKTRPRVVITRVIAATTRGTNGREHAVPVAQSLDLTPRVFLLDPYLLGAWLGDGHSRGDAISLHASEEAIAHAFAAFTPSIQYAKGNGRTWCLKDFVPVVKALGVWNNKHVPEDYFWGSAEQRLALLQGLMDTDGTIDGRGNGACTFDNTNTLLADAVQVLCASLGIKTGRSLKYPSITGHPKAVCQPCHHVHFTTTQQVFRHSRMKRERLPTEVRETQKWRYIDRVVPVNSTEPMRCITVDSPNQLYLCGKTMVVTHNTASALAGLRLSFEKGLIENPLMVGFTTASSVHDWRREAAKRWPELKFIQTGVKRNVTKRKSESPEEFALRKHDAEVNAQWRTAIRNAKEPTLIMGDYWWAENVCEEILVVNDKLVDRTILDEAHLLKKAGTGRSKAIRMLVARTSQTTMLTGTPVHNRAYDLHNILTLCEPSAFHGGVMTWARSYFHIKLKDGNYPYISELKDKPSLIEDIKPYVYGRTAAELMGDDLPARTHQLKQVDVKGAVRMSPAKMRAKDSAAIEALMREMVRHKIEAAVEIVRDADKPVVLYTYRREDAHKLAAALMKKRSDGSGTSVLIATGDDSSEKRDKIIERWKAGEAQALVCTMDAVRESATLTRADLMVFVDLSWLPATLLQCQGRIDPARQQEHERRPVLYIYIVVKGGPDEVVAETLVEKLQASSGIGVKNASGDKLADFLSPLDKRPGIAKALDPKELMETLVHRLNSRADRFADLGML